MEKLIKENILWILLVLIVSGGLLFFLYNKGTEAFESYGDVISKKTELKGKEQRLEDIKRQKEQSKTQKKKEAQSGKVIYEVLKQQFSPEASFGIMFENILSNITNSGLRIRSIDYNYQPADDKILVTNSAGYNACELSFVAVGNYSQLQNFFKSITKEDYLSGINEVYIEPYDKDKSILISRFKIRLYTKTI